MIWPDRPALFSVYERGRLGIKRLSFSILSAVLSLRKMASLILCRVPPPVARYYQPPDECRAASVRCRSRCRFQMRFLIAGATPLSRVVSPAKIFRDARLKDRHLSLRLHSGHVWKHPLLRQFS